MRCRVFSFALLASHHPVWATLATWALLAVCRILLHPLLVALHILWACGCGFFFLCTSSKQSGSDNDGEANGDLFHKHHYNGRLGVVFLMHPTLERQMSDYLSQRLSIPVPSESVTTRLDSVVETVSIFPDGHVTSNESTFDAFPRPKCRRLLLSPA